MQDDPSRLDIGVVQIELEFRCRHADAHAPGAVNVEGRDHGRRVRLRLPGEIRPVDLARVIGGKFHSFVAALADKSDFIRLDDGPAEVEIEIPGRGLNQGVPDAVVLESAVPAQDAVGVLADGDVGDAGGVGREEGMWHDVLVCRQNDVAGFL